MKKTLLSQNLYQDLDLESILNLGDITQKLIETYSREKIIAAMVEDSIYKAVYPTSNDDNLGMEISKLIENI